MLRGLLALAALLLAAPAQADAIDDYIRAEMARQHVPGLSLAIVRDGRLERTQGYGVATLEHNVPVHPDTLFKSGALGMQFTAAAVLMLAEDGRLSLDDPLRRFLPESPKSWWPITLRQLLDHSSGLPATPNGDFRTDYTDEQLLGILYRQSINFPPGARWRFSYTDYVVLGLIIRRLTGEHYSAFLARRIFAPAGMTTARLIDERAVIANRAAGYERGEGGWQNAEWVSPTANSTADGTLYLSALDLAAWEAVLASGRLLKPGSWQQVDRPARLRSGRTYPYGLGWYLDANGSTWRHPGTWQGFQTAMLRFRDRKLAVIVLANSDSADSTRIARHVAALVDPALVQEPAAPVADANAAELARARQVLAAIAIGTADRADYTNVGPLDFTEMMAEYRKVVEPLGGIEAIALFERSEAGDDRVRRYRARLTRGVVELTLGIAPNGRIGAIDLSRVPDWAAPL